MNSFRKHHPLKTKTSAPPPAAPFSPHSNRPTLYLFSHYYIKAPKASEPVDEASIHKLLGAAQPSVGA